MRKLPDEVQIPRYFSCAQCTKQHETCHRPDKNSPCIQCAKRGVECTPTEVVIFSVTDKSRDNNAGSSSTPQASSPQKLPTKRLRLSSQDKLVGSTPRKLPTKRPRLSSQEKLTDSSPALSPADEFFMDCLTNMYMLHMREFNVADKHQISLWQIGAANILNPKKRQEALKMLTDMISTSPNEEDAIAPVPNTAPILPVSSNVTLFASSTATSNAAVSAPPSVTHVSSVHTPISARVSNPEDDEVRKRRKMFCVHDSVPEDDDIDINFTGSDSWFSEMVNAPSVSANETGSSQSEIYDSDNSLISKLEFPCDDVGIQRIATDPSGVLMCDIGIDTTLAPLLVF